MRWNCPHCGVPLAVSDEKLGSGWSFSKCYKCAGFALVRRSDVNLIKVDKAPNGEPVILPESSEQPLLSQEATNHLARHSDRPQIRPATRRALQIQQQTQPPAFVPKVEARGVSLAQAQATETAPPNPLPEPLPEDPPRPGIFKFLPFAIGFAGVTAIGSGIYLYIQGQNLWQKARSAAIQPTHKVSTPQAAAPKPASRETLSVSQAAASRPALPAAPAPVRAPAVERAPDSKDEFSDSVSLEAMAPVRDPALQPSTILVEAKASNIPLRTGPGVEFPQLDFAQTSLRYVVSDWKDKWFKIVLPASQPLRLMKKSGLKTRPQTAWIRNSQVRLVQQSKPAVLVESSR